MARDKVPFQKGLREADFEALNGADVPCRAVVIASPWPKGFECLVFGGRAYGDVTTRRLFQCSARRRTSSIAGTHFASTHVTLRLWFRTLHHLTQSKQGLSDNALGRHLGTAQTMAWKIKYKLAQVMMKGDETKPLNRRVERDDAYLSGRCTVGKRGRGAAGRTPFVIAVEPRLRASLCA